MRSFLVWIGKKRCIFFFSSVKVLVCLSCLFVTVVGIRPVRKPLLSCGQRLSPCARPQLQCLLCAICLYLTKNVWFHTSCPAHWTSGQPRSEGWCVALLGLPQFVNSVWMFYMSVLTPQILWSGRKVSAAPLPQMWGVTACSLLLVLWKSPFAAKIWGLLAVLKVCIWNFSVCH